MHRLPRSILVLSLALALSACAGKPVTEDKAAAPAQASLAPEDIDDASYGTTQVNDPLEGFNRAMFQFNYAVERVILRPFVWTYKAVVPEFARTGIHNIFENWFTPVTVVNDLFQGKWNEAATNTWRFIINSTIGILGFADVAGEAGVRAPNEDFGQTLGHWGMGQGAYIVLPILGPSTVRDASGRVVDIFTDPFYYMMDESDLWWRAIGRGLDYRYANDKPIRSIYDSVDPYATMRSLYLQRRDREVAE